AGRGRQIAHANVGALLQLVEVGERSYDVRPGGSRPRCPECFGNRGLLCCGTKGSNPFPSSGESVSAVDSRAAGEKPRAFALVCRGSGTREGNGLVEHASIWPFLSEGH